LFAHWSARTSSYAGRLMRGVLTVLRLINPTAFKYASIQHSGVVFDWPPNIPGACSFREHCGFPFGAINISPQCDPSRREEHRKPDQARQSGTDDEARDNSEGEQLGSKLFVSC
jgi:hypothetical protein